MSNLTVIGNCSCCGKKYTEHEKVYKNPIGIPGKRENLCAFCYNYKKPKILHTLYFFIGLFVLIGLIQAVSAFIFPENKILEKLIAYSYLITVPLFLFFEIFISKKKIITK